MHVTKNAKCSRKWRCILKYKRNGPVSKLCTSFSFWTQIYLYLHKSKAKHVPKYLCNYNNFTAVGYKQIIKINCGYYDGYLLLTAYSWFVSSPEPKAQGEVLWSLTVRRRRRRRRPSVRPSVRPFTIFKQHLLLNQWLDFDQTSQEWSLVGPLSKLFKWFRSIAYLGHRS